MDWEQVGWVALFLVAWVYVTAWIYIWVEGGKKNENVDTKGS
jgi:hypothetical protein